MVLVASVVIAVVAVVAWFPAGALYHQRQTLDATATQLDHLRQQDRALSTAQQQLDSAAEIGRLARQQYELISPGQQAYEILPPNGNTDGPDPGDPGLQPLAAPSTGGSPGTAPAGTVPTGSPASGGSAAAARAGRARSPVAPGMVQRILQTLEFWR
jgi:cell division protein FtsB